MTGAGGIIIAAHDEESVIGRTLDALDGGVAAGAYDVHVVCNGCSDRTADIARKHGVRVTELPVASKTAALREGDRTAPAGPRIYVDADVVLTRGAAEATLAALAAGALAGRPPHRFDTRGAQWVVRRWYSVRKQLPSIDAALWGAGCYGLSVEGRARFDEFPDVVSDDLFVDSIFRRDEITIVPAEPVVVTTPRRLGDLMRILQRSYRTQTEVIAGEGITAGQRAQLADLAALLRRRPWCVLDVAAYAAIVIIARQRARRVGVASAWERDSSSRGM